MATYKVEIVETLARTIEVQAEDLDDAIAKVEEYYYDEHIVLNSNDFAYVEFIPTEEFYSAD